MPALKRLLALALLTACEGPTLYVGELEQPAELDAGEADASEEDAGSDARQRDAMSWSDGRTNFDDYRCTKDDDCRDPRFSHCNSNFYFCTNCEFDRDCDQGEYCDRTPRVWQCKKDKDPSSMGDGP